MRPVSLASIYHVQVHNQNPCKLRGSLNNPVFRAFYTQTLATGGSTCFYKQLFSKRNRKNLGAISIYHPPWQYRLLSDEYFTVQAGTSTWYFFWDRAVHLKAVDEIMVPEPSRHRLEGNGSPQEPLVLKFTMTIVRQN